MAAPQSPFFEPQRRRFTFGLDWILLVTLVAAAAASLLGYALSLPAVRSELDAWLGRSGGLGGQGDVAQSRHSQLIFLLMCYCSPMMLGLAARIIYLVAVRLVALLKSDDARDDEFRMET